MSVLVDVQVASKTENLPTEDEIRGWLSHAIKAVRGAGSTEVEVAVRIVGEAEGRALNKQYRHGNKATNVLSFPADDDFQSQIRYDGPRVLGDLVICGPVVEREAADQGKDPASHWGHLLVHGTLHLLGYDHESDVEAEKMEALERDILADRGIEDPYLL